MKKMIIDIVLSIFISMEFFALLLFIFLYITFPYYFSLIGSRITQNTDSIKFVSFIPGVLLGLIVRDRKELLFPDLPSNDLFQNWPNYFMIESRYYLSLIVTGSCFIICIAIWVLNFELSEAANFAIFSASITISVGSGPYWLDSLMVEISSGSVHFERHQAASAKG